jgi:hypothetical protein
MKDGVELESCGTATAYPARRDSVTHSDFANILRQQCCLLASTKPIQPLCHYIPSDSRRTPKDIKTDVPLP